MIKRSILIGCIAGLPAAASANLLTNPGFEDGLNGWIAFGNAFPETITPLEGEGVAKLFGTFPGVSGIFQEFDAAEGSEWELSVWSRSNSDDFIMPDNFAVQKIVFKDAGDVEIGAVESVIMDPSFAADTWFNNAAIEATAPANTVQVEAFVLFVQPDFAGGSLLVDNAVFTPAPGVLGLGLLAGGAALRRRR